MYTVQALWTQARENLNVTNIILANRKYAILQIEFGRVGAHNPGPKAMSMLDLTNPEINWDENGRRHGGCPRGRVSTAEEFNRALAASTRERRPKSYRSTGLAVGSQALEVLIRPAPPTPAAAPALRSSKCETF